jgi:hypothetical protein
MLSDAVSDVECRKEDGGCKGYGKEKLFVRYGKEVCVCDAMCDDDVAIQSKKCNASRKGGELRSWLLEVRGTIINQVRSTIDGSSTTIRPLALAPTPRQL